MGDGTVSKRVWPTADKPAKEEEGKEEKCLAFFLCREKSRGSKRACAHAVARDRLGSRGGVHFTKYEIETLHAILEVALHKEQAAAQAP